MTDVMDSRSVRTVSKRAIGTVLAVVMALGGALSIQGCAEQRMMDPTSDIPGFVSETGFMQDTIGQIIYDPALTIDQSTRLEDLKPAGEIKPLTNNFLTTDSAGADVAVDKTLIQLVINANIAWVAAANKDTSETLTLDSCIVPDSGVADVFTAKNNGAEVAFHTLTIGQIGTDGTDYYIVTRENFTLAANGALTPSDNVLCVYRATKDGSTLLIKGIAQG